MKEWVVHAVVLSQKSKYRDKAMFSLFRIILKINLIYIFFYGQYCVHWVLLS